ncbi:hypothetical protein PTSG_00376 [Salpingoeca rosetta]|uniref:SSD domain-containing protein n=1 Tax=Salpingoeca rosetta (strain ATCC 50818 / BSB-021) TaxID=946362 RepID=F2TWB0_SALR5|nr:uncharacterized protein PTSG_00376 [Salpingoeca rosetta]EGD72356.1 hypothetical protein PTSG_00376 [Salpingoeca rosetta]|eukprot:XP_004998925.1 hypothetical protein PTSG_00376 [Salpingoeca rosetta]
MFLQEWCFRSNTRVFAGLGNAIATRKFLAPLLFLLGALIIGGCVPGLFLFYSEENEITKLYVQEGSRLQGERELFNQHFGLSRQQIALYTSDSNNVATSTSFDSIIHTLTPIFKHDETDACLSFDGDTTTAPALCVQQPFASESLYCTCNKTAASEDQLSITWPGRNESGSPIDVTIYQKDLCETPPVPSVLAPSTQESVPAAEPVAQEKPVYQAALAEALADADAALSGGQVYSNTVDLDTLVTVSETVIQQYEASQNRSDLVTAGLAAYVELAAQVGAPASSAINSSLDTAALEKLWRAVAVDSNRTAAELQAIYTSVAGADGLSLVAASTVAQRGEEVLTIAVTVSRAVVSAFSAVQYYFARQQNFISYGYQAVAACVAEYTHENRERMEEVVFDVVIAQGESVDPFLTSNTYGIDHFSANGTAAARQYLAQQLAQGVTLQTNTTVQETAFLQYFFAADAFYTTIIDAERTANWSATGLAAAKSTAFQLILANRSIDSNDYLDAIGTAYTANGGSLSTVSEIRPVVSTAAIELYDISQRAITYIIQGVIAFAATPGLLMDSTATVNGTLRPLPRSWGIDRFPCSRVTPVDLFQEGGFDLPLNMRFLERISASVSAFFSLSFYQPFVDEAQCMDKAFLTPLKEAIYFDSLPSLSSYQGANFDAFAAGEDAYLTAIGSGQTSTVAAGAALQAFVLAGGSIYNDSAPTTAEAVPAALQSQFAGAIARAAGTASVLETELGNRINLFPGLGFWYRPSYEALAEDEVLSTTLAGIAATNNGTITNTMCILGNTDTSGQDLGEDVPACLLTWSGTKQPTQLVYGDVSATAVRASRSAANHWNEHLPLYRQRMEALLNRDDLTDKELERIHRTFELRMIAYLEPLYKAEAGTGYASNEPFASEHVDFQTGRSTSDVVDEAGEADIELLIAAGVVLAAYIAFSIYNLWSSVYSHAALAVWGMLVVGGAIFAALGLSLYFGVTFTPVSTSVVPFLALGIGVDDMFVLLRAYAREVKDGSKAEHIMTRVVGEAGPSVLFTSFTNLVAFLIAFAAPVEVVQLFAYQMAINVVLNFLLLFLLFVPAMYLDCVRVLASRSDIGIRCCHDDKRAREPSLLDRFFQGPYSDFLMATPTRVIVIIAFATWCGLAVWQGFFHTETGLRISDVAEEGTYQYDFASLLESEFQMYSGSVVTRSDDFPAAQQNILYALAALQEAESVSDVPAIGSLYWLHNFLEDATGNATQVLPEEEFYPAFASWLAAGGVSYLADLSCIDASTGMTADCFDIVGAFDDEPRAGSNPNITLSVVRGTFYLQDLAVNSDFTSAIRETRAQLDPVVDAYANRGNDTKYNTYATGYVHFIWEQYLHSEENLYLIVGLCVVGVFIATLVLQFNPLASVILCVIVLMAVIEVYGLLPIWDVRNNAFSLVNLCLSVGMGIEFTAHITHQFLAERGESRVLRVRNALGFMGTAMFHGAVSSILTTLFIAGSDTGFIREYFFGMFFATVVVCSLNGMVLLPVVLSLIGPSPINVEDELGDDDGDNTDAGDEFETMATMSKTTMTSVVPTTTWGDDDASSTAARKPSALIDAQVTGGDGSGGARKPSGLDDPPAIQETLMSVGNDDDDDQ